MFDVCLLLLIDYEFGACCVSLLYIYVDECGNYLHEKCCSNQTIRMYDNLRHTISLCDINDTSNEREKRRYERISTIDYESQITITITFINITIVKFHSFPLPHFSVSLFLLHTALPKLASSCIPCIARAPFRFDNFSVSFSQCRVGRARRRQGTSRFNTHFHFFIWKIICFP